MLSSQNLHLRQIHILNIIRVVVVLDLASRPIDTFDTKDFSFLDRRHRGNCRSKQKRVREAL